jgi:hypothetical protein
LFSIPSTVLDKINSVLAMLLRQEVKLVVLKVSGFAPHGLLYSEPVTRDVHYSDRAFW